jgi:hypothetical protein
VFYIDVAKVDRDVVHVAMTIYVCFECRFQMFHMFQTYVPSLGVAKVDLDVAYIYAKVDLDALSTMRLCLWLVPFILPAVLCDS